MGSVVGTKVMVIYYGVGFVVVVGSGKVSLFHQ